MKKLTAIIVLVVCVLCCPPIARAQLVKPGGGGPAGTGGGGGGSGDVLGGANLTTPNRLAYIAATGTLGQLTSFSRTGAGITERLEINNAGGESGFDIRASATQTLPMFRVYNSLGDIVTEIYSNGGLHAVAALTIGNDNAGAFGPTGYHVANNRGYFFSNSAAYNTAIDAGFDRPSAGIVRFVTGLGGSRASWQALDGDISGTLNVNAITGTAVGTSVMPFSTNLNNWSLKAPPAGNIIDDSTAQTLAGPKTIPGAILSNPAISGFTNAQHTHTSAATGGQLTDAALSTPVSVPKGGTGATTLSGVVRGNGTAAFTVVTGAPTNCVHVDGNSAACSTGGGADLTTKIDGTTIGQQPNMNFQQGTGISISGAASAPDLNLSISANTAVLLTRLNGQLGGDRFITLTSSTDDFVGTTDPAFTAYPTTQSMQLLFMPNVNCVGAVTLALNGLAAKKVMDPNTTSDMSCTANRSILIQYDPTLDSGNGAWRKLSSTWASDLTAGTLPAGRLPIPAATTLGGIKSVTCAAGSFIASISTVDGTPTCTAPATTSLNNGYYATIPAYVGYQSVVQPDSTVIKLWRHNIPVTFNATKICAVAGGTVTGGISRVGLYSLAAGGATATKILDSGDIPTDLVNITNCGNFASTSVANGSYFIAWASNLTTVSLHGQSITITPNIKTHLQSGPQPVVATGGTWAGPTNPLPATITVDTSTTPAGLYPNITIY